MKKPEIIDSDLLRNSILLIDKPCGITSFGVIAKLKNILRTKKAGHSGTLDKAASGLLVIGTGRCTKLLRYLIENDKKYSAVMQLGKVTDTCDGEGEILSECDISMVTYEGVVKALSSFTGEIMQKPPIFSALKIGGKRASDLVREGKDVDLKARKVIFHSLELLEADLEKGSLKVDVHCSKGTYIRSLARDLGEVLGTGAYMAGLRRTASGIFDLQNSVTLEQFEEIVTSGKMVERKFFYSPDEIFKNKSRVVLSNDCIKSVQNGMKFKEADIVDINQGKEPFYAVYSESEQLLAICEIDFKKFKINYLNVFN